MEGWLFVFTHVTRPGWLASQPRYNQFLLRKALCRLSLRESSVD
jgi:hypothetical protein